MIPAAEIIPKEISLRRQYAGLKDDPVVDSSDPKAVSRHATRAECRGVVGAQSGQFDADLPGIRTSRTSAGGNLALNRQIERLDVRRSERLPVKTPPTGNGNCGQFTPG